MPYKYVSKADIDKNYIDGVSVIEMPLEQDFSDVAENDIHFFRYNLKAGAVVYPKLEADKIVLLIFNGKRAFINNGGTTFHVTEPAFFIPDFDRCSYLVGAVEDTEFIMGVFGMNDWDKYQYLRWHKHLPFFKLYSHATEYDQIDCKKPGTRSWSILQGMMLGHVTVGVVRAVGSGTDEKGHALVHQWNYILGNSDFTLEVEDECAEQRPGDWSFIYGGKDHKLIGKEGKEVFYVWVEYYSLKDCTEMNDLLLENRPRKEESAALDEMVAREKAARL